MKKSKSGDTMLLTLCSRCAAQFYYSPERIIRRASLDQKIKEPCMWCNCKQVWDYVIKRATQESRKLKGLYISGKYERMADNDKHSRKIEY